MDIRNKIELQWAGASETRRTKAGNLVLLTASEFFPRLLKVKVDKRTRCRWAVVSEALQQQKLFAEPGARVPGTGNANAVIERMNGWPVHPLFCRVILVRLGIGSSYELPDLSLQAIVSCPTRTRNSQPVSCRTLSVPSRGANKTLEAVLPTLTQTSQRVTEGSASPA